MLLFIIQLQARAQSDNAEPSQLVPEAPVALPTPVSTKAADRALKEAYLDTFKVLSEANPCSDFYGGSAVAITALNELFARVRKEKLPYYIAFAMRGRYTFVFNVPSKASFRRFDQILLNSDGSFYQRSFSPEHRIPNIGPFSPATRRARSLSLLHELGHMIRSSKGNWLIPDDGYDVDKSRRNTEIIGNACNAKLRALK